MYSIDHFDTYHFTLSATLSWVWKISYSLAHPPHAGQPSWSHFAAGWQPISQQGVVEGQPPWVVMVTPNIIHLVPVIHLRLAHPCQE